MEKKGKNEGYKNVSTVTKKNNVKPVHTTVKAYLVIFQPSTNDEAMGEIQVQYSITPTVPRLIVGMNGYLKQQNRQIQSQSKGATNGLNNVSYLNGDRTTGSCAPLQCVCSTDSLVTQHNGNELGRTFVRKGASQNFYLHSNQSEVYVCYSGFEEF